MCMEDVRLGRETATSKFEFQGNPAVWTKIMDPHPNMYALDLMVVSGGGALVVFSPEIPKLNAAFPAGIAPYRITLDIQHHGDIIRNPLWIQTDGTSTLVTGSFTTLNKQ